MNTLFGGEGRRRRSTRGRSRAVYWIEGVLLIAGLVFFGWFGYNWIATEAGQLWGNYELDARLAGKEPRITDFLGSLFSKEKPSDDVADAPKPEPAPPAEARPQLPKPKPSRGESIGRIEIPRLGISALMRQGVDDQTLSRAVGHVPYTALPGDPGNVGVAAHRDTHFRNLRGVKEGDLIRLVTPEGTYSYEVESLKIVTPKNVEVLDPTPQPSLTLVTCYPFNFVGHAPNRFIVRARQLGVDDTQTLSTELPARGRAAGSRGRS